MDDHNNSLSAVLEECKKAAEVGYEIAHAQEKDLNKVLSDAEEKINDALIKFNNSTYCSPETANSLKDQLNDINQALSKLSSVFKEDLENLHDNMAKFSITLFGRTMTGKSTLMEILTEGNGESIGKGAQRTTRDVRKYTWNNLEITDVPGIGAFEGEDDEQIAFEAARTADLILFLVTDDGPQPIDADWFSKIINLGKPIMCIVNVKVAIAEGENIKLVKRDIQKKFDQERLETIRENFLNYANNYGQTWDNVPFIYVHLKSAYLAQHTDSPDNAEIYHQISRIDILKDRIVELVKTKGNFLRIKNFIDVISNPILEASEKLLYQSEINSSVGRTIITKIEQLADWKKQFYQESRSQINSLIKKIDRELKSEISAFAEDHFSDKNANRAWHALFKEKHIEEQCQSLVNELDLKVNDKLKEFSKETINELNFAVRHISYNPLQTHRIVNVKKYIKWSYLILSPGLDILFFRNPVLGSVVQTVKEEWSSSLFRSIEQKEFAARTGIEKDLRENVSLECFHLQNQMADQLNFMIRTKIEEPTEEMKNVESVIFSLAAAQQELAWKLNDQLIELNYQILMEALRLIGADEMKSCILSVARIPGNSSLIILRDGAEFPQEQRTELSELMSENIDFVFEAENKKILLSRILGQDIDMDQIEIKEKRGIAYVPLENITPNINNRVRLAQQLSKIQIIKQ